jgi:phospholipid/cholesterol/gamma-HCH transport system substrate-binding protein
MGHVQTEAGEGSRGGLGIGRVAALAAVIGAVVLVGLLLFGASDAYTVKARFLNGAQLVKGNVVDIGGTNAGLVKDLEITPNGQAEVTLEIDENYAPLRRGVRAQVRSAGQTSVSGRYVQLMLPSEHEAGKEIEDGGLIDVDSTTTNVDIDQFFSIFDPRTRKAIQDFYEGGQRQYAGRGEQANRGLMYLNPQLAASSRLFEELRNDPPILERFLVDSSRFVTALADRRDDLAALIGNLNSTTRALGSEKTALAEAIQRLPPFMRQANTTYLNLRRTLDELDPFVEASKPVARKLGPYLDELRPFAREAVPTVRRLRLLARAPGRANDLLELNRTYPALADITTVKKNRSLDFGTGAKGVGETRGAFPEMAEAFEESTGTIAHGRPYTPDFVGWMDDFSHTGNYDALGSFSRAQVYVNAFSMDDGVPTGELIPPEQRGEMFKQLARLRQVKRCPGASEEPAADGSNVYSAEERSELDCDESHRATGPIP